MKKLFIPVFLGLLLVSVSCQGLLDIPQKGVVTQDDFYASDADAEAALASMYANYLVNVAGTEGIDNPEQVILNYAADDILSSGGDKSDHDGFRIFDEFRYTSDSGTLKNCYQRYYLTIYQANLVISNFSTENREGKEPKYESAFTKQAVAEARVMRAYLHMMTTLMWYQPPLMDRLYEADEVVTNQTYTHEQMLDWVIDECQKAIDSGSLPVRASTADKDATARMSVGFAQFIAGKAAMFNNKPDVARKYLGDLIASKKYALIPPQEYWTNFHVAGDGNSEKIFEPNFIEDPAFTNNAWGLGQPIFRGRWMVANVFNWRMGALASHPSPSTGIDGWNGGAIQEDFAKKFLEHDGNSPRRRACFLTADEWLYDMDWDGSSVNNGTLEEKKKDPNRGISSANGVFSHGPYFEWKHMVFINPPKILTGGKSYPSDNVSGLGPASNQKNFNVARYAEALLLYAEACIGSGDEAKGLAALQDVQRRSGSGKISSKLTFEDVMEEKQYEMWFESCRFLDLVRWKQQGKVSDIASKFDAIHKSVPVVYDAFFTKGEAEHRLYTEPTSVDYNNFTEKYNYLPFPLDFTTANPELKDVLGWAK